MSTDQRTDLESNDLYQGLRRFGHAVLSGSNSVMSALAVVVLVVVLWLAYSFYVTASLTATSALWREMSEADEETLKKVAKQDAGSPAGRVARFHLSRLALDRDGLPLVSSPDAAKRKAAIESIEQARKDYEKLARDARGDAALYRESLFGQARAEEALVGVPTEADAAKYRGSLDAVAKLLTTLVKADKDSFQGQEAARKLAEIDKDRQAIEEFYVALNKEFSAAAAKPEGERPVSVPFLPTQPEPVKPAGEPKKDEPKKAEPAKAETPKAAEPKKDEAKKPEPAKGAEPKKADSPKAETPKAEPKKGEAKK